jgi:hypothetical protein
MFVFVLLCRVLLLVHFESEGCVCEKECGKQKKNKREKQKKGKKRKSEENWIALLLYVL